MLKLSPTPEKILPVEKPNGEILELKIKKFTLRSLKDREIKLKQLAKKYKVVLNPGKDDIETDLTSIDYLYEVICLSVDDLNFEDIEDLELVDINKIRQAIDELIKEPIKKDPAQKKTT